MGSGRGGPRNERFPPFHSLVARCGNGKDFGLDLIERGAMGGAVPCRSHSVDSTANKRLPQIGCATYKGLQGKAAHVGTCVRSGAPHRHTWSGKKEAQVEKQSNPISKISPRVQSMTIPYPRDLVLTVMSEKQQEWRRPGQPVELRVTHASLLQVASLVAQQTFRFHAWPTQVPLVGG
jgi:hypothetical protein